MAAPSGILCQMPRIGVPLTSGLKAYFYAAGTSTKQDTYTTSAMTVANSNPLSADPNGLFAAVYLDPALGYKIIIAPSTDIDPPGSPILTQDNWYLPAASYLFPQLCQGRLTLESGVPVSSSDQSAKATLYFTPYGGNKLALYNSTKTAWELFTFTELSLSLVGLTASKPYDIWVYNNAGTPTLEATVWTDATNRVTGLALQDGVYVKSGTATRRYLGTIYINASGGQTDDTLAKRTVWNYYNRVRRPMRVIEATTSWTYSTATIRQANGAVGNQLAFVVGVAEVQLDAEVLAHAANNNANINGAIGIGLDSTTAISAECVSAYGTFGQASSQVGEFSAHLVTSPAVGYHTAVRLEYSDATVTTTWYGAVASPIAQKLSGIFGSIEG